MFINLNQGKVLRFKNLFIMEKKKKKFLMELFNAKIGFIYKGL